MACTSSGIGCTTPPSGCPDQFGCISGVCPDFTIRRNDTKPPFKVKIEDCDGPLDLTGLVLEASMWAKGKLKKSILAADTYFSLADNIGFNQIMVGDIIIMDQIRSSEKMLVTGFDEKNYYVEVERGYSGTTVQDWKKGSPLRVMKFINSPALTEMDYQDIIEIDGTTTLNVLVDSFFVYEWGATDTSLPGCYYLEFKLIKLLEDEIEWLRRFPVDSEGFYIKITDSPTAESNASPMNARFNIEFDGVEIGTDIHTLNFTGEGIDDVFVDNGKATIVMDPDNVDGGNP